MARACGDNFVSLAIVILAAGASSRMRGRDKLFELVDGTAILRRLVSFAERVGDVYVTLPDPNHPRHALLTDTRATPVYVPDAANGMSASIQSAHATVSKTHATGMMILTGDLPDLTQGHIERTNAHWSKDKTRYVQAVDKDGKPGHPVIIPKSGWSYIEGLTGDVGLRDILGAQRVEYVSFDDHGPTLDLDTPEAWDAWRAAH